MSMVNGLRLPKAVVVKPYRALKNGPRSIIKNTAPKLSLENLRKILFDLHPSPGPKMLVPHLLHVIHKRPLFTPGRSFCHLDTKIDKS